jgi:dethiobiotin synthetase
MNYFVTAIGTDSGKTIVSSILCEALEADYWKPVQAGFPRDADVVKTLVSNTKTIIHPESYLLKTPSSPHAAARIDGITIKLENINLPFTTNPLIVEGAGGCLVPLNDREFVIDLITKLNIEIILVANLYLGSINHTLLTLEALSKRNLPIKGIIFNGTPNEESQQIILKHSSLHNLLHIKNEIEITPRVITQYAQLLKTNWK